jgi:uncharacterized protein (TIGR01777 family)
MKGYHMQKRVIVTGGTGLIGKELLPLLKQRGYQVVLFVRDIAKARQSVPQADEYVQWSAEEDGAWAAELGRADAVIHLAGVSVSKGRWNTSRKRDIRQSRVIGTRGLVNAMRKAERKPQVFVSSSATGYYGPRDDTPLDEQAAPGNDFLAKVCIDWEHEALQAASLGIRTVCVRTGIVLTEQGGALPLMALPFRLFGGGPMLPGTQWFPWIHLADELGLILFALENEQVRGPLNLVAPQIVRQRDFAKALGRALHRPSWFPVPRFALRIAVGEMADTITTGQRVIPRKAEELGYQFAYPNLDAALREIYGA